MPSSWRNGRRLFKLAALHLGLHSTIAASLADNFATGGERCAPSALPLPSGDGGRRADGGGRAAAAPPRYAALCSWNGRKGGGRALALLGCAPLSACTISRGIAILPIASPFSAFYPSPACPFAPLWRKDLASAAEKDFCSGCSRVVWQAAWVGHLLPVFSLACLAAPPSTLWSVCISGRFAVRRVCVAALCAAKAARA